MSGKQPAMPRRLGQAVVPSGDMGIGMCLQCLGELAAQPDTAPQPRFAVTFAPMFFPPGNPAGLVAVPACWEHIKITAQASVKPALLVANGGLANGGLTR